MDGTTKKRIRRGRKQTQPYTKVGSVITCKECNERFIVRVQKFVIWARGFTCEVCDELP